MVHGTCNMQDLTPMRVLVDNYESFTYNLVHLLETLGAEVAVRRSDEITVEEARARPRPARRLPRSRRQSGLTPQGPRMLENFLENDR